MTSEARIVTLQNPRYSRPTRYLVSPEGLFYEFTKIAAPKTTPRSWLLQGKHQSESENGNLETQVTKGAELYVASPIDPLFLILPALAGKTSDKKRMFLSSDDHFDSLCEMPDSDERGHLSEILSWPETRRILELRMAAVCDTVDAGDESMFRLNEDKLLSEIISKAQRMAEHGLPKSMQDKFVNKALEAPILGIKSTATPPQETNTPPLESSDSQSTISSLSTTTTSASEASTAPTSISEPETTTNEVTNAMTAPAEVLSLQKLRISFDFICSSYMPPPLSKLLKEKLLSSSKETVDFAPLETYLAKLVKLRQEAAAARAVTDYSRKRTRDEEDDARAEKKRKKDEEEKMKKAGMSRGVRELKKVNTSGMKKMSDFFKKK